jgi:sugar phosphate permease
MAVDSKINKTIRFLVASDFFLFFAVGLLGPIFAVFVLNNIENRIEVIGYAVSCYWITRVITVLLLSRIMDRIKGEFDEFVFMITGTLLISIIPLFYIVSSASWHIYALQCLNGLAHSMAIPAWRILFTNHIDRRVVGFEWSLEDIGVGIATAASAAIGAFVASRFGFNILFVATSVISLVSVIILLILSVQNGDIVRKLIRNKSNRMPIKPGMLK